MISLKKVAHGSPAGILSRAPLLRREKAKTGATRTEESTKTITAIAIAMAVPATKLLAKAAFTTAVQTPQVFPAVHRLLRVRELHLPKTSSTQGETEDASITAIISRILREISRTRVKTRTKTRIQIKI